MRLRLLAALRWMRSSEITEALVDLLIGLVHKINARAGRRVERELTEDLRRVRGKAKANERVFQAPVRTVLRGSYSNHYRRMVPPLLAALRFRCNNTAYRPVMQPLELLHRYAGVDGKVRFFADDRAVPLDGVVPKAWREAVVDERGRVERIPYELCVLVALRDALRRREI